MPNPLFQALGGGMPMMSGNMGNLPKMMQMFNAFRSGFQGNAQQTVQGLLNSGRMSQEQFNQLSQAASAFQQMTGIK